MTLFPPTLQRFTYSRPYFKSVKKGKGKGKAVPLQAWCGPDGSSKLRFPDYMTTAQDGGKVVSLTHRPPFPPGYAPGTHICSRLSRPQGHSAIGRIMSMENSNDTIWNRTSDLPICSSVTTTVPPSAVPTLKVCYMKTKREIQSILQTVR
jgi:hypothetical protein